MADPARLPHPERLVAGPAIDMPLRRHATWPERAMRWIVAGFWLAMASAVLMAAVLS
jgi:hypothetical protein